MPTRRTNQNLPANGSPAAQADDRNTAQSDAADFAAVFNDAPTALLLVRADPPDWTILAANDEYRRLTHKRADELIGVPTFRAFPETHGTESQGGQRNIRASFERALGTGGIDVLPIQRYDIPSTSDPSRFDERYWRLSSRAIQRGAVNGPAILHLVENVTDQVTARAAAQAAEDQLQQVFEQAPVAIAVTRGADHRFAVANPTYVALVGNRSLVGRSVRDALPELDGQGVYEAMDRVLATGVPFVAEERPVRFDRFGDGLLHWGFYNYVFHPLRDLNRVVTGIAIVATDVTSLGVARRDAEAARALSDERLRETVALNSALQRQQVELEELNTQLSEQAEELALQAEEARVVGEELEVVNERLRAAAEIAELARRAAEESERRFRSTADAAPVLIWTAGEHRSADWFNRPWLEFTGAAMEEQLHYGWLERVDPDDRNVLLDAYDRAYASRTRVTLEYRLRRADGVYRWIVDHGAPRMDPGGEFLGYVGSCIDITDMRRAREEALEANRAKSDFLAAMSHELRTPLNAIGGYVELLEVGVHGELNPRQLESLQRIRRSQSVLLRLVEDVLSFARLDAGHLEYRIESVSVHDLLDGIEALVAPQLSAKGLAFEYRPADRSLTARGDRDKLEQILINLLSNAIKFTDSGTVSVSARGERDEIYVVVRDTGRGIPSDKLDVVFEPFVQVDAGLTRSVGGTGLGLAIARELARGMGGDLTVTSTLGRGSEFTLRVPGAS